MCSIFNCRKKRVSVVHYYILNNIPYFNITGYYLAEAVNELVWLLDCLIKHCSKYVSGCNITFMYEDNINKLKSIYKRSFS